MRRLLDFRRRPRQFAILVCFFGLGLSLCWAYWHAWRQLTEAREARRSDSYLRAERQLDDCWRLPGLGGALDLERELLGVQQGDLRTEPALAARLASRARD